VFVIDEKETYFMGTNCYWCGFLTDNADVDTVFSHIAASGLKVVRVWGFNDITSAASSGTVWYQSFIEGESVQINTGADGLERLDVVVSTAESYGVSLIVNFVNNWDNYGGMQAYADYYDINLLDWYNSTVAQAQYQTYIEAVVSRYKTSTAIFAWELANEPRCTPGCDLSTIQTWATQTSAYIKSLDPNHMVTLGDEGFGLNTDSDGSYPFSTTAGGYNWTQNLAIPDIDFGTYHLYPSSWGEEDSWGPLWIEAHATAAAQVGKPVIAEEYGSLTITDELPWQAEVLATNTAGDMWWQYGDTLSTGETSNDGYAIYYGTALYEQMVIPHAEAMNAKAV
jgi:mannan endo-1,4-beta-mannosidase